MEPLCFLASGVALLYPTAYRIVGGTAESGEGDGCRRALPVLSGLACLKAMYSARLCQWRAKSESLAEP